MSPSSATVRILSPLTAGTAHACCSSSDAELRQRARGEHRRLEVGHRGHLPAERDQHRDLLEHAETAAAQRLRRRGGQDVGVDELGPQVAVEALVQPVELALALRRAHRFGDGAHQAAEVLGGFSVVKSPCGISLSLPVHSGQAERDHADDVALNLVGAAAEGQDQAGPVHPLDRGRAAARRGSSVRSVAAVPSTSISSR